MFRSLGRFLLLTVFLNLACVNTASSGNLDGPDVSGGGDTLVMNFKMAGRKVCEYLKNASPSDRSVVDPVKYCQAVESVAVLSQTKTVLSDGTEVDAINFPQEAKIILSRERNISKGKQDFVQLAAHEIISVLGIDDHNYGISGPLSLRMDMSDVVSSQPGPCLQIQANYKIAEDYETSRKIKTHENIYEIDDRVKMPTLKAIMDGNEHLVEIDPAGPNRDFAYERFVKIQCLNNGFRIEDRSNNFGSDGSGVLRQSPTYSSSISYVIFSEDQSRMSERIKHTSVNTQTGETIETEEKQNYKRMSGQ